MSNGWKGNIINVAVKILGYDDKYVYFLLYCQNAESFLKDLVIMKYFKNNKFLACLLVFFISYFLNLYMGYKFASYLGDAALWLALDIIFDSEVSRFFLTLLVVYHLYKAISCFF